MKEKLDRLNDIKTENIIWVIYIFIIVLGFIANNYETNYIKYNDNKSKDDYRNLMLLIFSVFISFNLSNFPSYYILFYNLKNIIKQS